MPSVDNRISYMYIEYSTAFHMKFKHLFLNIIYDYESADRYPLIITWAESAMRFDDDETGKALAVAVKTVYYEDSFKVTEEFFEDALQAFFLFPDINDDDEDSSNLRLEFVKALLNK